MAARRRRSETTTRKTKQAKKIPTVKMNTGPEIPHSSVETTPKANFISVSSEATIPGKENSKFAQLKLDVNISYEGAMLLELSLAENIAEMEINCSWIEKRVSWIASMRMDNLANERSDTSCQEKFSAMVR